MREGFDARLPHFLRHPGSRGRFPSLEQADCVVFLLSRVMDNAALLERLIDLHAHHALHRPALLVATERVLQETVLGLEVIRLAHRRQRLLFGFYGELRTVSEVALLIAAQPLRDGPPIQSEVFAELPFRAELETDTNFG